MGMVKVWNDNTYPFKSEFKGEKITIPPKGFVEMEYYEAYEFRGQYSPIKVDHDGQPLPESYKMIRVEEVTAARPEVKGPSETKCLACKFDGSDVAELERHVKEKHADQLVVDEEIEKEIELKKQQAATKEQKVPNGLRKEVR